jgi:hypothetical protein
LRQQNDTAMAVLGGQQPGEEAAVAFVQLRQDRINGRMVLG